MSSVGAYATRGQPGGHYLGKDIPEVFAPTTQGIGDGSVSGLTRNRITEARENSRSKLLTKALKQVRPKSTRPAWGWRQRDKVSSAWLLAIPAELEVFNLFSGLVRQED